jgi:AcrR family transcriptional regulator
MSDKVNRRDLIVDVAGQLFLQHGYDATSVRQIAEAAGVTEAALYYHFKDGKRALLQAVAECQMPDLFGVLEKCRDATSLRDLIHRFITHIGKTGADRSSKLRWLISEFPNFSDEERALFYHKHSALRNGLIEMIQHFVQDATLAERLASVVICATFGYGQLYWSLNVKSISDFTSDELAEMLSELVAARYE